MDTVGLVKMSLAILDARRALMEGLLEKGYGAVQLRDVARIIEVEDCDLFDVLAYVAYAKSPVTRAERVARRRPSISSRFDGELRAFVEFVLEHYVTQGVTELDDKKLPHLLDLRYDSLQDAVAVLGPAAEIQQAFVGFRRICIRPAWTSRREGDPDQFLGVCPSVRSAADVARRWVIGLRSGSNRTLRG